MQARALLSQSDLPFEERELFREPLGRDEIAALARATGHAPKDLLAWRSPRARTRALDPATVDDEAALDLMAEEPYLIRRPLVRRGARLAIGGKKDDVQALLRG